MNGPPMVRVGWAYREPEWTDDHDWHLCTSRPAARAGRDIRPVYLGAAPHSCTVKAHPVPSYPLDHQNRGVL